MPGHPQYGVVVYQSEGEQMDVNHNGVVVRRPIKWLAERYNGYMNLSIPRLGMYEDIEWVAGSRVPNITSGHM